MGGERPSQPEFTELTGDSVPVDAAGQLYEDTERTEALENELTSLELAKALSEVLDAEVRAEVSIMPLDEALGCVFTLLLESGVEDPEEFLKDMGILE